MTVLGIHHITLVCTDAQRIIDEEPDKLGTAYRKPPPQMVINNRNAARIDA